MAATAVLCPVGPTVALSVVATSHVAVPLTFATPDVVNFASVLNLGSVAVAVKFSVAGSAAVLPIDGTSTGDFVLPPAMQFPVVLRIPAGAVQVTAIGATSGPSIIHVTPMADQS